MENCTLPTEEFLRGIDIHELLPQQEPFVMIGKLVAFDEKRTVTETVIKEDNIFVCDGVFSASGLVENIAQTCAARIGYINKYILKKEIAAGMIGAVKDLEIYKSPHVGDVVTTEVEVKEEVFGIVLVVARAYIDETLIAEGEMKMITNDE